MSRFCQQPIIAPHYSTTILSPNKLNGKTNNSCHSLKKISSVSISRGNIIDIGPPKVEKLKLF